MKSNKQSYFDLKIKLRIASQKIKKLEYACRQKNAEERKVSEKTALLRSEIKQLHEANEFNFDEIARLKSEIKLPWFLAALLFSLLIWSLLLSWSLLL